MVAPPEGASVGIESGKVGRRQTKSCLTAITFLVLSFAVSGKDEVVKGEPDLLDPIVQMTHSTSPEIRAWGAYLAGRHRLAETAPALRALLLPPAASEGAAVDTGWKKGGDMDYVNLSTGRRTT